jgi:osmotically-inducible protein OsmY
MNVRTRSIAALAVGAFAALAAVFLARRLRERPRPSDVELLETLRKRLRDGLDLPPDTIELTITDGVVELSGEIDTPELGDELARRAAAIHGVVRVENNLTLPEAPVR